MNNQDHVKETFENSLSNCVDFIPEETYEQLIEKLALLSPIEYDQQRKKVAKKLDIRIQTLDEEVAKKRSSAAIEREDLKAQELFLEIEAWDQEVSGDQLLQELEELFRTFVVLPDHAETALALWVIFTWLIPVMHVAPILAISSPEKQCGKTTLLSVLTKIVLKPLAASNISPACVFRAIEKWKPTLLIDEADTFLGESEELRGILNSGHTRPTAYVIRTVGDDHTPKKFSPWGAKAIALIGKLPDTLHDRSIVITLKRKHGSEAVSKLRDADESIFLNMARKLRRFAQDYAERIGKIRPVFPLALTGQLSDRAMDNWEPLLKIAEVAGEVWTEKACQAALALSVYDSDTVSRSNRLLSDIHQVFTLKNLEKVSTADLINHLCEDTERPWGTYNRGKPLTQNQLAKLLKPYHISSKNIRLPEVVKGFEKGDFEDAWKRYISSPEPSKIAATAATNRYTNTRETATCSGVAAVAAKIGGSGEYKNVSDSPPYVYEEEGDL